MENQYSIIKLLKVLGLLLISFGNSHIHAQKELALLEFAQIGKAYEKYPNLSFEMEYQLFQNFSTKEVMDIEIASIHKKGNWVTFKMGDTERLSNEKMSLFIDHDSKIMMLDESRFALKDQLFPMDAKTTLSLCNSISVYDINEKQRVIEMEVPLNDVSKIRMTYDSKNYLLERITIFYRQTQIWENEDGSKTTPEQPRLEVNYINVELNPKFKKGHFDFNRFCTLKKNRWTPNGKWKDYRFNNFLASTK